MALAIACAAGAGIRPTRAAARRSAAATSIIDWTTAVGENTDSIAVDDKKASNSIYVLSVEDAIEAPAYAVLKQTRLGFVSAGDRPSFFHSRSPLAGSGRG